MTDGNAFFWEIFQDSYLQALILSMTILLLMFPGKAVPSSRTIGLVLLPLLFAVGGFFWSPLSQVTDFYNIALCLALLADRFFLSVDPADIDLRRRTTEKFSICEKNPVTLILVNNSTQALRLQVSDDLPEGLESLDPLNQRLKIEANSGLQYTYFIQPMNRGAYRFGQIYCKYESRLGLLKILKQGGREDTVKVYPDLKRLQEMRLKYSRSLHSGELIKRSLGSEGTQFSGLRTYYAGDDVKKVDWKATARLDEPVVKTFSSEVDQPILILLDAGRKMETRIDGVAKFDWALNAALSFAGVALDRGDQVGVGVFHNRIVADTPMSTGKTHLQLLLENLHDLRPQTVEPDYERVMLHFSRKLKRRSLIIIFTDLIDPMASDNLIQSLQLFSSQHLMIVVTLADSDVADLAALHPSAVHEAYEKGVAQDLINLRRKNLRRLMKNARHTSIIDTPPRTMDEALINEYLTVKLKNRL